MKKIIKILFSYFLFYYSNACLCPVRETSVDQSTIIPSSCNSAKCYDEKVAQDFCNSDFCVEASIKSDKNEDGKFYANISLSSYEFRAIRLVRFTPLAIKAIKSSRVYTPTHLQDCGVHLRKGSIYYLCGTISDGRAVVSSCDFVKRSESLNLAERSFFISGFNKANCRQKESKQLEFKPSYNESQLQEQGSLNNNLFPSFAQLMRRTSRRPSKRPSMTTTAIPPKEEDKYHCLLVPTNALSLNQLLKNKEEIIETSGQYILFCVNKLFCIPQTQQLEQWKSKIKLQYLPFQLIERDFLEEFEFKAQMPKPALPQCPDLLKDKTYLIAPWSLPLLDNLPSNSRQCSQTIVEVSCNQSSKVILSDGMRVTSNPSLEITTIVTNDGSVISVPLAQSSRLRTADGTECRLARDGSSLTVFKDKSSVSISAENNINIKIKDNSLIVFNSNGMSLTLPDRTTIISSEYGMVVTTPDGNNTLIPVDSNGTEIKTDSSDIVVTEGLNAEIKSKTGTQVLITPEDTTIGTQLFSINVLPEGTVTIIGPQGVQFVFSVDQYVNMTTLDGTLLSLGVDDSLFAINDNQTVVVFPNGNSLVVTRDEIISLEADGTALLTDQLGSNQVLPMDQKGIPCIESTCNE